MAEPQMDGGSGAGTTANANGGASGNQSVQQPSFDAAKLQSSIDALIEKVDTLEARTNGLQSVKDKTTKEISGLKAQIAEYEQLKERLGADGAIEQIELKQTLAEIKQQLSSSVSTQATGTGASGAVNAAKAFADVGFTDEQLKDPRVGDALRVQYQSQEAAELAAYRLQKQFASNPSPNAAQAASLQGRPAGEKTQEQMKTDLAREQAEISARNVPHTDKVRLLTELEEKYRKEGLR